MFQYKVWNINIDFFIRNINIDEWKRRLWHDAIYTFIVKVPPDLSINIMLPFCNFSFWDLHDLILETCYSCTIPTIRPRYRSKNDCHHNPCTSFAVYFELNRDTNRRIHAILTTMVTIAKNLLHQWTRIDCVL